MDFNNTNLLGVAAIGSLVAFWSQIKGWISSILSLVIRTDMVGEPLSEYFIQDILGKSKIIRWGNAKYANTAGGCLKINGSITAFQSFLTRQESSLFILYKGWIPCVLKWSNMMHITYLYPFIPVKRILDDLYFKYSEDINKKSDQSFFSFLEFNGKDSHGQNERLLSGMASKDSESPNTSSGSSGIPIPYFFYSEYCEYVGIKSNKDVLVSLGDENQRYWWSKEALLLKEELSFFMSKRPWFSSKNLTHFRGCLLSGAPGVGKSLAILECAKRLGVRLYRVNIANMSNEELSDAFRFSKGATRVILIEDVDAVFEGRTNVLAKNSMNKNLLSFDFLINTISHSTANDGVFLVMTTNHPEKLDPALVRAGRCDVKIEMGGLCRDGRKFIASNILGEWPELVGKVLAKYPDESMMVTPAAFEAECIEMARERIYQK